MGPGTRRSLSPGGLTFFSSSFRPPHPEPGPRGGSAGNSGRPRLAVRVRQPIVEGRHAHWESTSSRTRGLGGRGCRTARPIRSCEAPRDTDGARSPPRCLPGLPGESGQPVLRRLPGSPGSPGGPASTGNSISSRPPPPLCGRPAINLKDTISFQPRVEPVIFQHVCRSVMADSLRPHGLLSTGSSVHGIFQARILEWVAMPSARRLF